MKLRRLAVGLAGAALFVSGTPSGAVTLVDVELQLLVDVSNSVDAGEFALQRSGYASAFRSADIQSRILGTDNGRIGKVATQLIYWSNANQQAVVVDWTLLDSTDSINGFADAIEGADRLFFGDTAPGSAIAFGTPLFAANDFEGLSNVMDVSGDGVQNDGLDTATARDGALAAGVDRINGLPISSQLVKSFYEGNVIGGADGITGTPAFALFVSSYDDVASAVSDKLGADVSGTTPAPVPLPASGVLLLSGLLGVAGLARRLRT